MPEWKSGLILFDIGGGGGGGMFLITVLNALEMKLGDF